MLHPRPRPGRRDTARSDQQTAHTCTRERFRRQEVSRVKHVIASGGKDNFIASLAK